MNQITNELIIRKDEVPRQLTAGLFVFDPAWVNDSVKPHRSFGIGEIRDQ